MVIDMRKMNAVRVDKEEKVGYIQGGTTVVRAAKELLKHGMATTLGGVELLAFVRPTGPVS